MSFIIGNWIKGNKTVTVRFCRYAYQESVTGFKMRWRLAAWLVVWGGLLSVEDACALLLTSNTKSPPLPDPVSVQTVIAEEEKGSDEDGEKIPDVLLKETEHGPVKGTFWGEYDNILAFIDIPYGAFKYFAVSVTN